MPNQQDNGSQGITSEGGIMSRGGVDGLLREIELYHRSLEREEAEKAIAGAEQEARVTYLETQLIIQEKLNLDLMNRCRLLEKTLREERFKYKVERAEWAKKDKIVVDGEKDKIDLTKVKIDGNSLDIDGNPLDSLMSKGLIKTKENESVGGSTSSSTDDVKEKDDKDAADSSSKTTENSSTSGHQSSSIISKDGDRAKDDGDRAKKIKTENGDDITTTNTKEEKTLLGEKTILEEEKVDGFHRSLQEVMNRLPEKRARCAREICRSYIKTYVSERYIAPEGEYAAGLEGYETSDVMYDGEVLREWKPYGSISGHLAPVTGLQYDDHRAILLSASEDSTIKSWDMSAFRRSERCEPHTTHRSHNGPITSIIADFPNDTFYSGGADHEICKWNLQSSKPCFTYCGHTDTVLDLTKHKSRNVLASCSQDNTVRLWDVDQSVCLSTLSFVPGNSSSGNSSLGSASGGRVGSGSVSTIGGSSSDNGLLPVSSRSSYFHWSHSEFCVSSGYGSNYTGENPKNKSESVSGNSKNESTDSSNRSNLGNNLGNVLTCCHFLDDSLVLGFTESCGVYNVHSGRQIVRFSSPGNPSNKVLQLQQFSPTIIAAGNRDGFRLFDISTGKEVVSFLGIGPVVGLEFGESYVVSASLDGLLRTYDLKTRQLLHEMKTFNVEATCLLKPQPSSLFIAGSDGNHDGNFIKILSR